MERTFIAIKPDGVQRGLVGDIIKRFEQKGFRLVAMKFLRVRPPPLRPPEPGRRGLCVPAGLVRGSRARGPLCRLRPAGVPVPSLPRPRPPGRSRGGTRRRPWEGYAEVPWPLPGRVACLSPHGGSRERSQPAPPPRPLGLPVPRWGAWRPCFRLHPR